MRKLFGATFGIAAILSLVVGVAFAWTSQTASVEQTAQAGAISVALGGTEATNTPVYPGGGWTHVRSGTLVNNSGIGVSMTNGTAGILGSTCDYENVSGQLRVVDSYVAPNTTGGKWEVDVAAESDWNNSCQGSEIRYLVTVDVTT